jgi:hypothetical protein
MGSIHFLRPSAESEGRDLSALSRAEQTVVWTLRHARSHPDARAARRGEWAVLVRGYAPAAAAAGEALAAALADAGRAPACLALRNASHTEEWVLEALAAVHANAPERFRAACRALGTQTGGVLAGSLAVFAGTIEAGGVRLAAPAGAAAFPGAAVARWIQ